MVIALRSLKSQQPQVHLCRGLVSSFALLWAIVSSGEDDVVCISRPPDALAFLCPQTRLALLFPLLSLDTLCPHGFFKSERHSLRKQLPTQSPGSSELNELLLSSWSLLGKIIFIPHQAGGLWLPPSACTSAERNGILSQEPRTCTGWSS